MDARRVYSTSTDRGSGVMAIGESSSTASTRPSTTRRIPLHRSRVSQDTVFVTQQYRTPAVTIAGLYKTDLAGRTVLQADQWHVRITRSWAPARTR